MYESYFQNKNEFYFMAHSALRANRPTLLFIHGIGDSHIDYLEYLHSDLCENYNILIPDLLGHGKSSAAEDYSFAYQAQGIEEHINYLQKCFKLKFNSLILIAHSMGGIHATLLCESKLKKIIKAFFNVEGSITQFGSFIATNMVDSLKTQRFEEWFNNFKQHKVYESISLQYPFIRPYYAALEFCQPNAFLKNAMQMYKMSRELDGKYTHVIGKQYAELNIPTIYCYGDSLAKENLDFLNEHQLPSQYFPCKTHFLLSECQDQFIKFLQRTLCE